MADGNNLFDPGHYANMNFYSLITAYKKLQSSVALQVKTLTSSASQLQPGKFLQLQYLMSQVTQVGDSISNLMSQVQSMMMNSIRNQKSS